LLQDYGWSEALQSEFAPHAAAGLFPGRISAQHRGAYELVTDAGERRAEAGGRLLAEGPPPAVGDFVAADVTRDGPVIIRAMLARRTAFTRLSPEGRQQVVAANVDVAFLVASLEGDLNLRRLERYLVQAWASGAEPALLLTKADLCADADAALRAARHLAAGAQVLAVSAIDGGGLDGVRALIGRGRTAVMVGASGAGKSTLANALLGEARMAVGAVRADDARGRHTTSHRQLMLLPGGGLLLDTPGMRELALDAAGEGVAAAFDDVEALARDCRFKDCAHESEPGCAVQAALASGELDPGRWRSFQKLAREADHQAAREDPLLREENRRRWVAIHKASRARYKARDAGW
jgi:ribosome biogenesis GTPase